MMHDNIHAQVKKIVNICGTRDPMKIACELGIHIAYRDDFNSLKGMYAIVKRNRFIAINNNLNKQLQKTVCAHEIGHDRLHQDLAKLGTIQEFMLYDMQRRPEYEANIFAADLLIDDNDIFDCINSDYDVPMIAGTLDIDINLVLIKLDSLRLKGYDIRVPFRAQSGFLKQ